MSVIERASAPVDRVHDDTVSPVSEIRLLFVSNAVGVGGSEKHLLDLIQRLAPQRTRVSILQVGSEVYSDIVGSDSPVELRSAPVKSAGAWYRQFREETADVVVFVSGSIYAFPWFAPIAVWAAGAKRIVVIHHLVAHEPERVSGWSPGHIWQRCFGVHSRTRFKHQLSSRFTDRIICVSKAVRDRLVNSYGFSPDKTIAIPNGVALEATPSNAGREAVRARLGIEPQEFVLVCVARLVEIKGMDVLLNTLARVVWEGTKWRCLLVGEGPLLESLAQQAQSLGISRNVAFEGFQKDVPSYLRAADAFILTSHNEGLPLSILEAMAQGLPCVVTDVGGNSEAVRHGVDGFVLPDGAVEELAEAVRYLGTHVGERQMMGAAAAARVKESFDMDRQMAQVAKAMLG